MTARRSFLARFGAAAAAFGLGSSAADAQPPAPAPPRRAPPGHALAAGPRGEGRLARSDSRQAPPVLRRGVAGRGRRGDPVRRQFLHRQQERVRAGGGGRRGRDRLRHRATQFAFTDAIWAKYGAALSESEKFTDPKTSQAPIVNVYRSRARRPRQTRRPLRRLRPARPIVWRVSSRVRPTPTPTRSTRN